MLLYSSARERPGGIETLGHRGEQRHGAEQVLRAGRQFRAAGHRELGNHPGVGFDGCGLIARLERVGQRTLQRLDPDLRGVAVDDHHREAVLQLRPCDEREVAELPRLRDGRGRRRDRPRLLRVREHSYACELVLELGDRTCDGGPGRIDRRRSGLDGAPLGGRQGIDRHDRSGQAVAVDGGQQSNGGVECVARPRRACLMLLVARRRELAALLREARFSIRGLPLPRVRVERIGEPRRRGGGVRTERRDVRGHARSLARAPGPRELFRRAGARLGRRAALALPQRADRECRSGDDEHAGDRDAAPPHGRGIAREPPQQLVHALEAARRFGRRPAIEQGGDPARHRCRLGVVPAAVDQRFAQGYAERVLIRRWRQLAAFGLLRRHEPRRPDAARQRRVRAPGGEVVGLDLAARETEVEHAHAAVVADHRVLGLEVAVDDAAAMRCRQPFARGAIHRQDLANTAPLGAVRAQVHAAHPLHDEVDLVTDDADIVDRNDVGMRQLRERLALQQDAGAGGR